MRPEQTQEPGRLSSRGSYIPRSIRSELNGFSFEYLHGLEDK
jgi:hypothetical protein